MSNSLLAVLFFICVMNIKFNLLIIAEKYDSEPGCIA